jgi:hypothetical protein
VEGVRSAPADRSDDVGAVAGSDLGGEDVLGAVVGDDFQDQVDRVLLRIELIHNFQFSANLHRIGPGAHAHEPADIHSTRLGRRGHSSVCRLGSRDRSSATAARHEKHAQDGQSRQNNKNFTHFLSPFLLKQEFRTVD